MNIQRVDFNSNNAAAQFSQSLKETGFGVLYNHPVDQKLIDEVYAEWIEFFASQYKNNYVYNRDTQDGFFPISISETAKGCSIRDLKEFFHYYPWGMYPAEISEKTKLLYQQLNELAITLLHWVEQYLPTEVARQLSMPLSNMIEQSPMTLLRVIHYPPLTGEEKPNAVRAAAHGDINLLTVLVGATTSGLQVKDSQDNWHDVPCDRNSLAINIGDMLERCTQGFYKSTQHRVINPEGTDTTKARLSMPLFLHPKKEVILKKPDFTAGDFLHERLIELGVA